MAGLQEKLDELKQSLLEYDVVLDVRLDGKLHDREVRLDNGWTIKIGRGLDFYQKPDGWFAVGATDLSLRRCLETKVDVFCACAKLSQKPRLRAMELPRVQGQLPLMGVLPG